MSVAFRRGSWRGRAISLRRLFPIGDDLEEPFHRIAARPAMARRCSPGESGLQVLAIFEETPMS